MKNKPTEQLPIFVYGTLLPGQPNYYQWGDAVRTIEHARLLVGRLYGMGHFPMLLDDTGDGVVGALVTVHAHLYDGLIKRLDALEDYRPNDPDSSMYLRVKRKVLTTNQVSHWAWTYIGKPKFVRGLVSIGGDWLAYSEQNTSQIEVWWQQYHQNPQATLQNRLDQNKGQK